MYTCYYNRLSENTYINEVAFINRQWPCIIQNLMYRTVSGHISIYTQRSSSFVGKTF